jgi:hypothetical protein
MKKLIFILMAAVAFSCGGGSNRSSEREDDSKENTELAEPDTTSDKIQNDSTMNDDMNNFRKDTTERNK